MRSPLRLFAVALALWLATSPAGAVDLSREARWLVDYLRIDSSNPPGREGAAAAYLAKLLQERGFAVERFVTASGRTSLAARLAPTVAGGKTIVLLHHLDVVPPGEGWTAAPFAARIVDGEIVARGAIDDKSLGIAELAALLDAAKQPVRRRGLLYLAVADEESGGGEGLGWLFVHHPELFTNVEAALDEGGLNRTVLGRTLFWGVEVAQKRALWLELTAHGRPGHASSLNPDSAAHQLIRALAKLIDRPPAWRLQPAAAAFLAALGRVDPTMASFAHDPASALGPDGRPSRNLPPAFDGLLLDTLQVTRLTASDRVNVVAPSAEARLDIRLLPDTDEDAYLDALREAVGPRIKIRVLLPPGPRTKPSPASGEVWDTFASTLAGGAPLVPVMIPGITDSRYFRQRGIAAYGISPFELEALDLRRVHGPDERISVRAFDAGVARMKRLVEALVGGGAKH